MFAVNRQHHRAVVADGLLQKSSAADNAFLVGMQNALARFGGSKGRGHPRSPHHGNNNRLRFFVRSQFHGSFGTAQDFNVAPARFFQETSQFVRFRNIGDTYTPDIETNRYVGKLLNIAVSGNGKQTKLFRIKRQNLKRTLTNGARGSQ